MRIRHIIMWLVTIVVIPAAIGYVFSEYAKPVLGVLVASLGIVLAFSLVPAFMVFGDWWLVHGGDKTITYLTDAYVIPWQNYFTVKVLLAIKGILASNGKEYRMHLTDLIAFLDSTRRTRYLSSALTEPSLDYVQTGGSRLLIFRSMLSRCQLDSLDYKINALRTLASVPVAGREEEVSRHIAAIAASIVPYQRLKKEIARRLSVGDSLDQNLLFGIDKEQYISLLSDIKSPQCCEVEIWNQLVNTESRQVTASELRKRALRLMLLMTGLSAFMIALGALVVHLIYPGMSLAELAWWLGVAIFAVAFGAFELLCVLRSIKNFTMMGPHLKNNTIFTPSQVEKASAQIVKDGLKSGQVSRLVVFGDNLITRRNFVYRCAHAFLAETPEAFGPVIRFPSPYTTVLASDVFVHCHADVRTSMPGIGATPDGWITKDELANLSSRIVNVSEEDLTAQIPEERVEQELVWLYSNAIRLNFFDHIEVAEVGKLSFYTPPPKGYATKLPLPSLRKARRQLSRTRDSFG